MKSKSVITYSTVHRTWSTSLSRLAVGVSLTLAAVIMFSVVGSFYLAGYLIDQRTLMITRHNEVTWNYKDAIRVNSHLKANIYELSRENDAKDYMLESSEVVSYMLKQKKTNNIFTKELVSYAPILPAVGDKMEAIFDDVSHRLLVLYALPSGKPLEEDTYVSSGFGPRVHPLSNSFQFHEGIDIPVSIGDPVLSSTDGTVTFAGRKVGYGITVKISHRFGFGTLYAHLDKALVKRGDIVKKGQIIAEAGNTGISTGAHLHHEITYLGKPVNPYHFHNWNLANFDTLFSKYKNIQWQQITEALQTEAQAKAKLSSLKALN